MAQDVEPSLTDRAGFWATLGAVPGGVGAVSIAIAIAEYHRPWATAWFIAGAVACALGCVSGVWALVLSLARKVAAGWYRADRQRFMAEHFSVQREALTKINDLISDISEELWNFRNEQQSTEAPTQLQALVALILNSAKSDRLTCQKDFEQFIKHGRAEMEAIRDWTERRQVFTSKIRAALNDLSVNTLTSGSPSVANAVDAYRKGISTYIFAPPKDSLKIARDERIAKEQVLAAVGKALREGPFGQ